MESLRPKTLCGGALAYSAAYANIGCPCSECDSLPFIRRAMMIAYAAEAGNQSLLETHRKALMRSAPDFIESLFRGENQLFQKPEHTATLLDGLRKAGFPE